MSAERHTLHDVLTATISPDGAELCALRGADGRELLWDAGPRWPSHSPILFPIVGQVARDRIRVDGREYALPRHGFARRRQFQWVDRAADHCSLELADDEQTRAVFPFPFHLLVSYALRDGGLHVVYELHNPGSGVLPASLGAHPAFRWPLADGAQTDYRIEFAEPEPEPIFRLRDGLLDPAGRPTPVDGRRLDLDPALFADDAIIMLAPRSHGLRYLGPGGGLTFEWTGFPQLGLWQKPGADFLCIEPWQGFSSPLGFDGEFADKPGVVHLAPGQTRSFGWTVRPIG